VVFYTPQKQNYAAYAARNFLLSLFLISSGQKRYPANMNFIRTVLTNGWLENPIALTVEHLSPHIINYLNTQLFQTKAQDFTPGLCDLRMFAKETINTYRAFHPFLSRLQKAYLSYLLEYRR
jgi:hypothetical protein